jgi:hypothetical protein
MAPVRADVPWGTIGGKGGDLPDGRGARPEGVGGIGPKVRTFRRLSLEGTFLMEFIVNYYE